MTSTSVVLNTLLYCLCRIYGYQVDVLQASTIGYRRNPLLRTLELESVTTSVSIFSEHVHALAETSLNLYAYI